jgi:hypothetical protein
MINLKGCDIKRPWLIPSEYPDIYLEGVGKIMKHLNQDSRFHVQRIESDSSR